MTGPSLPSGARGDELDRCGLAVPVELSRGEKLSEMRTGGTASYQCDPALQRDLHGCIDNRVIVSRRYNGPAVLIKKKRVLIVLPGVGSVAAGRGSECAGIHGC